MATAKTSAAPAVQTQPKGKRTVTVACKFPAGLVLQLCKKTTFLEDTPSGPRERSRFDRVGEAVVVRGPAEPAGQAPDGYARPQIVGGYALTSGIDADFFEEWLRQNKDAPFVASKIVFAHATHDAASGEARELKDVRSGFEPLDTKGDARVPRPITAGVGGIETASREAA